MIDSSEIVFAPECRFDNAGRVLFAQGRVFRAINPTAEGRILDFFNSALCKDLIDRGLLVRTWVANDISVPGYHLILEHEKLFCSNFSDWSFNMRKAVARTAIKMQTISKQHGWYIKDPFPHNFAISNGRIVFYDFGSFIKGTNLDVNRGMCIHHCLPLLLMATKNSQVEMMFKNTLPGKPIDKNPIVKSLLKRYIKKYDIYHHYDSWHFLTRCRCVFDLVPYINRFVQIIFPDKAKDKRLLKSKIVYKDLQERDIKRITNPYESSDHIIPVEDSAIIDCAARIIDEIGLSLDSILCVGNFKYENLSKIQNRVVTHVNVMTLDSAHVDTLFNSSLDCPGNINLLACNILDLFANKQSRDNYVCDMVIVQDYLDVVTKGWHYRYTDVHPVQKFAIVEAILHFCRLYLLVPSNLDQEILSLISKDFYLFRCFTIDGKEVSLYKKHNERC